MFFFTPSHVSNSTNIKKKKIKKWNFSFKRHITAIWSLTNTIDSESVKKKIFCPAETKIIPPGKNSIHYIWRTPGTCHWLISKRWIVVAASCYGGTSQWKGKGDWSELRKDESSQIREVCGENLLQSVGDLRLGQRFTFQHYIDPKHKAKTTL